MDKILRYLADLEKHNNRDWYHAHKGEYGGAYTEFERLLFDLIDAISSFDPSVMLKQPKELIFRLARDMRFSRDKTPYNPSFRACISRAGRAMIPVSYYITIAPNNGSFLGGGLYAPTFTDATAMVRDYIVDHGDELETIIDSKEFSTYFVLQGEKLKNIPRGYEADHPQADLIKHKSWYVLYNIDDRAFENYDKFIEQAAHTFEAMKPFNDFLNQALKTYPPKE
ncbi:TIGR02453 family protein [Campylobacterota bacterium]|nr:TIGR02453 family protein [Campylobacterota bacterium]